jgi:hypothetical protein
MVGGGCCRLCVTCRSLLWAYIAAAAESMQWRRLAWLVVEVSGVCLTSSIRHG